MVIGAGGLAIACLMLVLGYQAGTGSETARSPAATRATEAPVDRSAVEAIIRDYLLANPELMLEVQTALEARQEERQRAQQGEVIARNANALFGSPDDGIIGNPDADVTIVEFFDYNCGFCRRALGDMDAMLAEDGNIKFALKEFPILGPDSHRAHVVSMAVRKLAPNVYPEFHRRLLSSDERADEARAIEIALSLGIDEAALRQEMQNPEIEQAFMRTYQLANELAISGTPSYVVGDEVVFGAQGHQVLKEKVANLRRCESTTC
jgi:protein-disulfide isomerase